MTQPQDLNPTTTITKLARFTIISMLVLAVMLLVMDFAIVSGSRVGTGFEARFMTVPVIQAFVLAIAAELIAVIIALVMISRR